MNTKQVGIATAIFLLVLGIYIGYGFAKKGELSNKTVIYGDDYGAPKNCRAIIKSNIDGYKNGDWNAEAALDSIDRNCGEFGYSW